MRNEALWQHSRHWLNIRPAYAFGRWMLDNLPPFVGYALTRSVLEIAYRTDPRLRTVVEGNVRHVLARQRPDLAGAALDREARSTAHEVFVNRGRWFADLTMMGGSRRLADFFHFQMRGNWQALTEARASGRGAILASAHLGNWHGGGVAVGLHGIPVRAVMYLNHAGATFDQGVQKRGGIGPIYVNGDPFTTMEIVRALRKGDLIAMLADRPWDARWVEMDFFGRPSRFPLGPVRIARLAEVPIFPAFCVGKLRNYTATLCDPIWVRGGDPEAAEREALGKLVRIFEEYVSAHLTEWFYFTPAWSDPA
jgi:KDO2-lipid IV(A) lauroyltransferase